MIKSQHRIIGFFSLFFLILPTRVFIGISSDIIQITSILGTAIFAFMTILLSIDHTFGLKGMNSKNVGDQINKSSKGIQESFIYFISFLLSIIIVKAICLWFITYNSTLFFIIDHIFVMFIGGFFVACIFQFNRILGLFSYLSIGAELGAIIKANQTQN